MDAVERFRSLTRAVSDKLHKKPESLSPETFILEAQVAAIAKETPTRISGTIYFSRDFVTEENVARHRKRQLEKYGYVGDYSLETGSWRGEEDALVSSIFKEIKDEEGFPQDIILAVYKNEPGHYFRSWPLLRGLISESGLASHGMILTREYFSRLEDKMKNLIVLSNVDISLLQSGDKVIIDIQDNATAKITVNRLPDAKKNAFP